MDPLSSKWVFEDSASHISLLEAPLLLYRLGLLQRADSRLWKLLVHRGRIRVVAKFGNIAILFFVSSLISIPCGSALIRISGFEVLIGMLFIKTFIFRIWCILLLAAVTRLHQRIFFFKNK